LKAGEAIRVDLVPVDKPAGMSNHPWNDRVLGTQLDLVVLFELESKNSNLSKECLVESLDAALRLRMVLGRMSELKSSDVLDDRFDDRGDRSLLVALNHSECAARLEDESLELGDGVIRTSLRW